MRRTILATRRATAVNRITEAAAKLPSTTPLDLSNLPKGNAEHRQLFLLERVATFLESVKLPAAKPKATTTRKKKA